MTRNFLFTSFKAMAIILFCIVIIGNPCLAAEQKAKWVLSEITIEKSIGLNNDCYATTMDLTQTSSTLKVVNKQCGSLKHDPVDWSSSASWQAFPSDLEPGGQLRVSGKITRESYDPGYGQSDHCNIFFQNEARKAIGGEVRSDPAQGSVTINGYLDIPLGSSFQDTTFIAIETSCGSVKYHYVLSPSTTNVAAGNENTGTGKKSTLDDISWVVVIGGIVVAGIVLIGGGLVLKGRTKPPDVTPAKSTKPGTGKDKEEKEEKKSSRYILQLSTDRLSIEPGKPANLMVTVWKQVGSQLPQQASEAGISLTLPAEAGLIITPSSGQGHLNAQVRAGDAITSGEFPLTVTATARGSTQEATVMVSIKEDYVMRFE